MKAESPEVYLLSQIPWQFFVTLTFDDRKTGRIQELAEKRRLAMVFAWLREGASWFGLHFNRVLWVWRLEAGEVGGRLHYHALIGGYPTNAVQRTTCFSLKNAWERLGGGYARVRVYSRTLDGVDYVLAGCEAELRNLGADQYESRKFSGTSVVMCSKSLLKMLKSRRAGAGGVQHCAEGSKIDGQPMPKLSSGTFSQVNGKGERE